MGTGKLYTGEAAQNMFKKYMDSNTTTWMELGSPRNHYFYTALEFSVDLQNGTKLMEVPSSAFPSREHQYYDTGAVQLGILPAVREAVQKYFDANGDAGSLTLK